MVDSRTARARNHALIHGALIVGAIAMLFPIFWMVSTSLKPRAQCFAYPPVWFPNPIQWNNYKDALTFVPFSLYFRNTLTVAILVVIGSIFASSFVAYGFARFQFPGRDLLFTVLISTMMVPLMVRLVPLFLIYKQLGWINTFLPLTVPAFLGTPVHIFLVRQYFLTLPEELADAARIDGCSELGIWARIVLPLSKPILTVVGIQAFQHAWNDFTEPLVYLSNKSMFTLALGLRMLMPPSEVDVPDWHWLMAASTATIIPMIVLFAVGQKQFIGSVTLTGIKG